MTRCSVLLPIIHMYIRLSTSHDKVQRYTTYFNRTAIIMYVDVPNHPCTDGLPIIIIPII